MLSSMKLLRLEKTPKKYAIAAQLLAAAREQEPPGSLMVVEVTALPL
jgi:hypothetical protein